MLLLLIPRVCVVCCSAFVGFTSGMGFADIGSGCRGTMRRGGGGGGGGGGAGGLHVCMYL